MSKTRCLGYVTAGVSCVAQTFRLMLLGSPPDMVHGVLSHRTHRHITKIKYLTLSSVYSLDIIIQNKKKIKGF